MKKGRYKTEYLIQSQTQLSRYLTIEVDLYNGIPTIVKVRGQCAQDEKDFFEDWGTLVAENNPGHRPRLPTGWHYQGLQHLNQTRENPLPYDFSGVMQGQELQNSLTRCKRKTS
jgi:hypothetical protein